MALARVVSFDGVTTDRMKEMRAQIDEEPPEGLPAKEIIVLHDPEGEKSLVIIFFDSEDDYRAGDEVLNAMPTGDTPGQRASVARQTSPRGWRSDDTAYRSAAAYASCPAIPAGVGASGHGRSRS